MANDLNQGAIRGKVLNVNHQNKFARVTVAVNDDYKDANNQYVNRQYIIQVSFVGEGMIRYITNNIKPQTYVTMTFKLTSFKPEGSEYHTTTVTGLTIANEGSPFGDKDKNTDTQPRTSKRKEKPQNNNPWGDDEENSSEDIPW